MCAGLLFCFNLCLLLAAFLALAIICDDFLVPPIEHFCEKYDIPDEAAGASFLAFGSSAPEIVIATIATLSGASEGGDTTGTAEVSAEGGSATGLSTVLGEAAVVISWTVVCAALLD